VSHVLGWKIMTSFPEFVILEARSRLMTAHNLLEVHDNKVAVTTFVRYEKRAGRWLWLAASQLHRLIVPRLLNRAASQRT
jgi:hypothetical protein